MSKYVCNYAAIRFLPYRETGEFVNVGVIAYCPESGYFDFRLFTRRSRRVSAYFPELKPEVFVSAVEALTGELRQYRNDTQLFTEARVLGQSEIQLGLSAFRRLTGRREGLLHFSDPGSRLVEDPKKAVQDLYHYFVDRSFAHKPDYQEQVMRARLDGWLEEWNLRKLYRANRRIGNDVFHVTLPYVYSEKGRAKKGIKLLDLDKSEPTDIYEHGDAWVQKMRRLETCHEMPQSMIFTVKWPDHHRDVADEIVADLRKLKVDVFPFERTNELRNRLEIPGNIL